MIKNIPKGYDLVGINSFMLFRTLQANTAYLLGAIACWYEDPKGFVFLFPDGQTISINEDYRSTIDILNLEPLFKDTHMLQVFEELVCYTHMLNNLVLIYINRNCKASAPVVDPIYFGL